MLRLSIAYAKKIPAATEYSSQNFHCSIDTELPNLSEDELRKHIRSQYVLVRSAVEEEINGSTPDYDQNRIPDSADEQKTALLPPVGANAQHGRNNTNGDGPASPKQLRYLKDLLVKRDITAEDVLEHYRVDDLGQMSRAQVSTLIDQLLASEPIAS